MTRNEVIIKLRGLGVSEVHLKGKRLVTLSSLYWLMTAGLDECFASDKDICFRKLLSYGEDVNELLDMSDTELYARLEDIEDNSDMHPNESDADYLETVGW